MRTDPLRSGPTKLLALVVVVAAVVLTATASANTPVSGAAFTTVNEGVDGTDHCKNGNPNVNCNIYDGKEFVWLNGGPSTAYVGDGDYFFAVLEPGGQGGGANPNDGTPKNLSDDFDAYTNRSFSVSGATVSYTPGHDFDSNKIRLMPYADTSNPGGVYILAICSLADGYPVDPSDCKYDAFKIREQESDVPDALFVTKSVYPSLDREFTWDVDKSVDKTSVTLNGGGSATFNYVVSVTHDAGTDENWAVNGVITVVNSNSADVTDVDVTDAVNNGGTCVVTDGTGATIPANDSLDFNYTCTWSSEPSPLDGTNTASATWPTQSLGDPYTEDLAGDTATFEAPFTFDGLDPANVINNCTSVDDTFAGHLGNLCSSDPSPTEFKYSRTINFNPAYVPSCLTYDNTATVTGDSDSQTVQVCFYGPRFTPGYWRNHLAAIGANVPGYSTNCKSSQGCSSNGPWTISGLPISLGGYNVDTISKVVSVFDKMNCNNLTTANNALGCLTGHLLAAKLNRKINNSNPCIDATIAAADAFLIARGYVGPSANYTLTAAQRATAISIKTSLDQYNNGGFC